MSFPANVIPVFGSQRPYVDLNFALGSFGVNGGSVSSLALLSGFTFTRASLAMGYDATGKLTYGPNNLLVRSEDFSNASWVKSNSTVAQVSGAEWTLTEAATTSRKILYQTLGSQIGNIFSIEVKPNGRNYVAIGSTNASGIWSVYSFNVSTGATVGGFTAGGALAPTNPAISSVGSGWYRVSVTIATADANLVIMISNGGDPIFEGYAGNGTSGLSIRKPQSEAVTYQTTPSTYYPTTTAAYYGPRLVYDPVTLASQGILVEEARTNLCLQSQTFDNATWTKTGVTVTANSVLSPDGTTNADTMVEAVGVGGHYVNQAITTTAAAHTFSAYIKAAGRTFAMLYYNTGNVAQVFDLANGTVGGNAGANAPTSASIQSVGNGWCRCSMVVTTTAALNGFQIYACSNASTYVYTGDGTSGLYLYQAQLELGQGASSPIPTTTAAVTRAAEDVTLTGLSVLGNLTLVEEGRIPAFVSSDARTSLSDGSTNNRVRWTYNGTQLFGGVSATGSGDSALFGVTTLSANAVFKAATSINSGVYRGCVNGGTVDGTTGAAPATLTQLDIGKNVGGGRNWNNTISRIRIYNRALPDAQLQSLTT